MKIAIRMVAMLLLLALLLFCVFGFLATFEPMDHFVQITWRIVYGVAGVVVLAGFVRMARRAVTTSGITRPQREGIH